MVSRGKLLGLMKALSALASIAGVLILIDVIVATLSMGFPIFTGQRKRDAVMLAMICLPVLQFAIVVGASRQENANPATATKLYALTVPVLAILIAIPALA
jgi:hypothetical protein